MIRLCTLAATAAALLAIPAQAQNTVQQPAGNRGAVLSQARQGVSDALFAAAAASGGMAELNLSQLGLQRASNSELKEFSRHMLEEHTKINQKLMSLLAQKQIAVPRQLDARAQFCADSLASAPNDHFDACYAKAQCVLHEESLATFEAEAERGRDPQIKALATEAVPKIKEHLAKIKAIVAQCEKNAGGDPHVQQTSGNR
jgi:putative membrane protein